MTSRLEIKTPEHEWTASYLSSTSHGNSPPVVTSPQLWTLRFSTLLNIKVSSDLLWCASPLPENGAHATRRKAKKNMPMNVDFCNKPFIAHQYLDIFCEKIIINYSKAPYST
jgi:hypothetical protein